MSIGDNLINIKNRLLKNQSEEEKLDDTNCIYPKDDEDFNEILTDVINNFSSLFGIY